MGDLAACQKMYNDDERTFIHCRWVATLLWATWHLNSILERSVVVEMSLPCPRHIVVVLCHRPVSLSFHVVVPSSSCVVGTNVGQGGTYRGVLHHRTMTNDESRSSLSVATCPASCVRKGEGEGAHSSP
jgi:hypothetical protein